MKSLLIRLQVNFSTRLHTEINLICVEMTGMILKQAAWPVDVGVLTSCDVWNPDGCFLPRGQRDHVPGRHSLVNTLFTSVVTFITTRQKTYLHKRHYTLINNLVQHSSFRKKINFLAAVRFNHSPKNPVSLFCTARFAASIQS